MGSLKWGGGLGKRRSCLCCFLKKRFSCCFFELCTKKGLVFCSFFFGKTCDDSWRTTRDLAQGFCGETNFSINRFLLSHGLAVRISCHFHRCG